jgi:SAM-dependent methyltransferase
MGNSDARDRIELLPVSLLDDHRSLVQEFRRIASQLQTGFGWHYLLDLTWAARILNPVAGQSMLDAGASTGMMQWWLAAQGVDVLSVDRLSRANLDWRFRSWCPVAGLRPDDLGPVGRLSISSFLPPGRNIRDWHHWPAKLRTTLKRVRYPNPHPPQDRGTITIYNQELDNLIDIPNESLDAVVSISALEHNSLEGLSRVVNELLRVLKPGGLLVATLPAAKERDWYHEPSRGWCLTDETLRHLFRLSKQCPSNYAEYDKLFEMLRNCSELRDKLSRTYFRSGNNGMPWGIWDPKYQPVGVIKQKESP